MRNGALPFIPSIFIVFTSKVGLLVARLRLSGIKAATFVQAGNL